eukprot:1123841-Amphidinium_carterae.1
MFLLPDTHPAANKNAICFFFFCKVYQLMSFAHITLQGRHMLLLPLVMAACVLKMCIACDVC